MKLESENLTLRHWQKSDAECLYYFAKNPKIGPIAGWMPHQNVDYSFFYSLSFSQYKNTQNNIYDS